MGILGMNLNKSLLRLSAPSFWRCRKSFCNLLCLEVSLFVHEVTRELSKDEWKVIDGVLNIKPQRGIVIPKII